MKVKEYVAKVYVKAGREFNRKLTFLLSYQ
jgi:hypothetical protein